MKQTIRNKTFETNSSSMHSLVVVKHPKPYKNKEFFDHCISDNREFNLFWYKNGVYDRTPFQVLRDPVDKLRYYVAHYIGYCEKKELIPEVESFINKQTGIAKDKINLEAAGHWKYGRAGVNDTGEDVFTYIEKNHISLEEFVLNPKYVIIVDGDEYQEFAKLFKSNILNANDFEYISSGVSFWNEDVFEIYTYWLDNKNYEYHLLTHIDEVNEFIKTIKLYVDTPKAYEINLKEIKMFLDEVKKKNTEVKTVISCVKAIYKKLRQLDISMFDYIEVKKEEYSDDAELIKLIK